jgi:hypothetical protein
MVLLLASGIVTVAIVAVAPTILPALGVRTVHASSCGGG